jgi:hypothetical protein
MFVRAASAKASPIPLCLGSERRIVTANSETILGWIGGKSDLAPAPLTLPDRLLAASPTSCIAYACNLPAVMKDRRAGLLDVSGRLPAKIGSDTENDFLSTSLPGGQTSVIAPDGKRITLQLRWVCLTANFAIGAVWRCFARMRAGSNAGSWNAIEHDYIFEAGGGAVLNPPGDVKAPCAADVSLDLKLSHPDGMLTSFPCDSGRVKVTWLSPDGWPQRSVVSLALHAGDRIVALFSDGRQETVATAAASQQRRAG